MTIFKQLAQLKRMDNLIRRKATGTPDQLAERLEVSRATIFRYLDELKAFGADIRYCKERRSYIYSEPFELNFENFF